MVNTTRLTLLGPPAWRRGADGAALPWLRPTALLAIIACHDSGIGRDALASMMRPDADEATARAHLRRNLHRVRALLPADAALHADGHRLRWRGACDVAEFLAAIDARDWKRAIALHSAPLLAGTGAFGDAAIDEWVVAERERLLGRLRVALIARLSEPACDDAERALCITRLIDLDPMDENALQSALEAANGPASRTAALAACELVLGHLKNDAGIAPMPRTLALRGRISDSQGHVQPVRAAPRAVERRVRPRGAFAWIDDAAPLVGRDADVRALIEGLIGGPSRLITLVGFGGVGKTRLALAAAQEWSARTQGTLVRVGLAEAGDGRAFADAVANAVGLAGQVSDRHQQIVEWLALKNGRAPLLLLLDNFDALVADRSALAALSRWLAASAHVRVLVTSREALGVPSESRFAVGGLDVHGPDSACASLFAFHARRLGVTLQSDDARHVQTIAERTEGHPLALELAASWLPALSVAEIVAELDRGLAFLVDEDVATIGHRSLRAVFMRSWQLLTPRLREVLSGLTVFVGGADHDAARGVCSAQRTELLRLVGKSLLRRSDDGRFTLHPVVQQFAGRELSAARCAALLKTHAEFFLARMASERDVGLGRMDPAASRRLDADFDNLELACRTALRIQRHDLLSAARAPLEALFGMLGHLRESREHWELAIDSLPDEHPCRTRLHLNHAAALIAMGDVADAEQELQTVQAQVRVPADLALLHNARSTAAAWRGDYEQARVHAQAALQAATESHDVFELMRAQLNVALIEWVVGNVEPAEPVALAALALAEAHGATVFRAQALRLLASVRVQQHRFDDARTLLAASSEYFAAIGDDYEVAYNERVASGQARKVGDTQRQLAHALRAVSALEALGVPAQYVASLVELSLAHEATGDAAAADTLMHRALTLAMRLRHAPLLLSTIGQAARVHAARGSRAALGWLAFVLGQSSLRVDTRSDLKPIFERLAPTAAQRAALLAAQSHLSVAVVCGELLATHAGRVDDGTRLLVNC